MIITGNTASPEVVFDFASYNSSASLGNNYFMAFWRDGVTSIGACIVGHFTGDSIRWASGKTVFNDTSTDNISSASLDNNYFVVSYRDVAANSGFSRIGYFTGDSISWASNEIAFNSNDTNWTSTASLGSNYFVVSYRDVTAANGSSRVGYFTGSSISWQTAEIAFSSGALSYISSASLGNNYFVVSYRDDGNSWYGTSRVGYFTGDSISWASNEITFNNVDIIYTSTASLGSNYFVVSYRDNTDFLNYGTSRIGYFTGDSISWKAEEVFNSDNSTYVCSNAIGNNYFDVSYVDSGNSNYGTSRVGYFTGDSISWASNEIVFNDGNTVFISSASLGNNYFVVNYRDTTNLSYGTSRIINTYFDDSGLRIKSSSATVSIASEPLVESTHKLRLRKSASTVGIPLVNTTDANASGLRIYDGSAVKALRKYA